MKSKLIILLTVLIFTNITNAQNDYNTRKLKKYHSQQNEDLNDSSHQGLQDESYDSEQIEKSTEKQSRRSRKLRSVNGFTVGAFVSSLDVKGKSKSIDSNGVSSENSGSSHLSDTTGLRMGYTFRPAEGFGFQTLINYYNVNSNGSNGLMYSVDANLIYAINELFHIKGGLNMFSLIDKPSEITGDSTYKSTHNIGIGGQIGIGFMLGRSFEIEINYTQLNTTVKAKSDKYNYEIDSIIQLYGPALALNYIF